MWTPLLLLVASVLAAASASECEPRSFGEDSVVCVCSASSCDFPGNIEVPASGQYTRITSSRDGLRFSVETAATTDASGDGSVVVRLDHSAERQEMMGFGGAFTDSTGISVLALPEEAQDMLMRSYFSPEGIEYNLCRVPIAGSDFSTRPYSYDDVEGDVDLVHFSLTEEDHLYKLPLIHRARGLSRREFMLFGSPWSPPAWMKENGMFNGTGGLLREMWQPWSDYFVKFVHSYEAEGVPLWGLTTQNEPLTGFGNHPWNTCAWSAEDQRDWIKTNLGPTLEAAGLRHLKLMVLDHNRDALPTYPGTILDDPESRKYVDGIAVHWYGDFVGPEVMTETHDLYPDSFLLYTESCEGWNVPIEEKVKLGDWRRAENYAFSIIEDVNHWSTGWVDWNMALDTKGGPNWANNVVDSPIIVDKDGGEFYKQPMFYAMGHFSKFVGPGYRFISPSVVGAADVSVAAFHSPDADTSVVVILNRGENEESVSVDVADDKEFINFAMPARSIVTLLFQTPVLA